MSALIAAARCGDCVFSRPRGHGEVECRRYPPSVTEGAAEFPLIGVDDWCGEFTAPGSASPSIATASAEGART